MSNSLTTSTTRIAELDGIRGLAILLVLIWHLFVLGVPIDPQSIVFKYVFYLRNTWCGVDLFFVLSGFLIGGILLDARNSPRFFSTFYLRRFARIVPLYLLTLAGFILARYLYLHHGVGTVETLVKDPAPLWTYFTFTQNIWNAWSGQWGPHWLALTWSLAVEEQFYLTLPLAIRFLPLRVLPWFLAVLVIAAPIFRTILFYHYAHGPLSTYWLMPCRLDALCLGVLGALLVRSPRANSYFRTHSILLWLIFLIGFSGSYWLTIRGQGVGARHMATWGHTALAIMFWAFMMITIMRPRSLFAYCMRFKPLCYLGVIAYGLYLLHYPLFQWLHLWWFGGPPHIMDLPHLTLTIVSLGLIIALASLSWHLFEKPIVRLGHKLKY